MQHFMFSDANDNLIEFMANEADAKAILRAFNLYYAGKKEGETVCFGFVEGPQFQGQAGSALAMDSVRSLSF